MPKPKPENGKLTYATSGVDVDANTKWVGAIESAMRSTYGPRVLSGRHGLFAGLFRLDHEGQLLKRNYRAPVLVGCADGVGTKLLLSIQCDRLSTIGIDLVAMNINDLITVGAEPLFFLDYLAVNKLDPAHLLQVIEGIAAGCRESGCALLGGETAEMPDVYREKDLDLAGFAVGVVEENRIIDGSRIEPGDVLIGLPSSGVHSNGYTLVRKLIEKEACDLSVVRKELGESLADALLRPTRIYANTALTVVRKYRVKRVVSAMAHITGGGLRENIGRLLPADCNAQIRKSSWTPPPVFEFLRRLGVDRAEMFKVFNMGIGFVFIVRSPFATGVLGLLRELGEKPIRMGRIVRGMGQVRFE